MEEFRVIIHADGSFFYVRTFTHHSRWPYFNVNTIWFPQSVDISANQIIAGDNSEWL